jgi:hypothetical protein
VEDPATVWHLGPQRYPEIARRYRPLTKLSDKLAIDINVVERYQDVYPTKQQTGTELFQLVRLAAGAFPRVTLYFENSVHPEDQPMLPAAAAAVTQVQRIGESLAVESRHGVGIRWTSPALVNGRPWPVTDGRTVWLPAGAHVVATASSAPSARLLDLNAELRGAATLAGGIEFAYRSASRALALVDRKPIRVEVDDAPASPKVEDTGRGYILTLPRGQHLVRVAVGP